jgi:hypothetical protein
MRNAIGNLILIRLVAKMGATGVLALKARRWGHRRHYYRSAAALLDLVAGDGNDFAGIFRIGRKLRTTARIARAVQSYRDCLAQRCQRQFQVAHVVPEVLIGSRQSFVPPQSLDVHAEGTVDQLVGQPAKLIAFTCAALVPFADQFMAG